MSMIRIGDLFEIKNGYSSSNIKNIFLERRDGLVEYKRPSNKLENTTAGYVEEKLIPDEYIFPEKTLFVSTDGQGSHTFSYVAPNRFVPNSNISVLIPGIEMTLIQKLYYARCITANRYKFSYGRKPKGKRLADILVPSPGEIPSWVYEVEMPDYREVTKPYLDEPTLELKVEEWKEFRLDELFEIEYGTFISTKFKDGAKGTTPYITTTAERNGIGRYIKKEPDYPANSLTIATDGTVGEVFYQDRSFCASNITGVLIPKFEFNVYVAMFIITVLKNERFRYSYGRKWSIQKVRRTVIKLPATPEGNPDWGWMEKFIKGCGFSRCL